jgi:1-aminocyclopropane-1-carboxylate deaminase/D-cysteine desulfhydrase-like pyridoxal-dependent ACC family enzyme
VNTLEFKIPSPLQKVDYPPLLRKGITLYVKRDDLIHPDVSGNKWRKLNHNVAKAVQRGSDTLLTLGGAYSNHIAATAAAGAMMGLKTIGVIRGEDADLDNSTLSFARSRGMSLHRISREAYREAGSWDFMDNLKADFGHFYFIPEGGSNQLGVLGCMDILKEIDLAPKRIFVASGTATTLSGMALANRYNAELYGVSALKGGAFLRDVVAKNLKQIYGDEETEHDRMAFVHLLDKHHFGGYAKTTDELIRFIRDFWMQTGIKLDPVYTAKCAFAMCDFAERQAPVSPENWVLVHTGGMQGVAGIEHRIGQSLYPDC